MTLKSNRNFRILISRNKLVELKPEDEYRDLDADIEGDVLVLDPDKLGKRLQGNVDFDKMQGRNDNENMHSNDLGAEDEMILEPNIDAVRKRVKTGV
eukprot:CAMPEP_0176351998 /NCGR_PEP_ID=MMETSP0126-20121128/10672_1 /TAXON_ID=141414 ORGANISM="Strombidinopsis acuminatum, Strain SPMC142" /NCGR_SAMPLE_ID=MMETSP0126 /ASSEMBLY_ACC=CAM_ASM_000229 /LENGTH=96 /DNA_ID=CAMNT_0017702843 /DNA_START=1447 /DNA_END=1736 /DNA_ORIENTATION=-